MSDTPLGKLDELIVGLETLVTRLSAKIETKLPLDATAVAAARLATPRAMSLIGDGTGTATFDGSSDLSLRITLKNTGVVAGTYGSPDLIPVATVNSKGLVTALQTVEPRRNVRVIASSDVLPPTGEIDVIYMVKTSTSTHLYRWNGASYENMTAAQAVSDSAVRLTTPRTFVYTGDVTGSVTFDGSANVNVGMELLNTGVVPGEYARVEVDAKGRVTKGSQLRIGDIPLLNQNTTGNAATASKLFDSRVFTLTGDVDGVAGFDGSADLVMNVAVKDNSHNHTLANITGLSTALAAKANLDSPAFINIPTAPTAAPGTNNGQLATTAFTVTEIAARSVSKTGDGASGTWGISIAGNAATATRLATARNISLVGDASGVAAFDGSTGATLSVTLANTGVIAGSYGTETDVPVMVVDSKGRVVSVSNTPIRNASLTATGLVRLNNTVTSTSTQQAATASAVKQAYDLANAAVPQSYIGAVNGVAALNADRKVAHAVLADNATLLDGLSLSQVVAQAQSGTAASAALADEAVSLQTPRLIAISGDATASVAFDGTTDVALAMTLANSGVGAGTYGGNYAIPVVTVDAKGRATAVSTVTPRIATTGAPGVVQLSASVNSTSNALAATPGAVKQAYDLANAAIPKAMLGIATGVAELDESGFVKASQLPSFVDSVVEFDTLSLFPVTGEKSKIYTAADTNRIYRWSGSGYIEVSPTAGNADSATKLATSRLISLAGDATGSVSFDGTANVSISVTVQDNSHNHTIANVTGLQAALDSKLNLSGGNVTGRTAFQSNTQVNYSTAALESRSTSGDAIISLHASGSTAVALRHIRGGNGVVIEDATGITADVTAKAFIGNGTALTGLNAANLSSGILPDARLSGTYTGVNITGNAATATKLATARSVALTGAVTGSVTFDGSANVSISTTLAAHTHAISEVTGLQAALDSKLATAGGTISGNLTIATGIDGGYGTANGSGSTWGACIWGMGPSYDGSGANTTFVNTGLYGVSWLRGSHAEADAQVGEGAYVFQAGNFKGGIGSSGIKTTGTFYGSGAGITNLNAANLATGIVPDARLAGTYTGVNITGNAATATKLATARTINGVSFDGTANIVLPAGAAETADALTTARTVALTGAVTGSVLFDGSANVSISTTLTAHTHSIAQVSGLQTALDAKLPTAGGTLTGSLTLPTAYASNWFRSTGATGWYSQDFGGGVHMSDTTWVRIYGSKALYVSNDIAATGDVTAFYSDERLKENIRPLTGALAMLRQFDGVRYNANELGASFGYDRDRQEVGFLAQKVQSVLPEVVAQAPFDRTAIKGESKTGEHYLTLKYERMLPVVSEAIKEVDDKVEVDRKALQALTDLVQELSAKVDALQRQQ